MLIIFDCDGVLVDSERLAAQVFSNTLKSAGCEISSEMCFDVFKGHTLERCYEILKERFSFEVAASFNDELQDQTRIAFSSELRPVAGVVEVLEALAHRGISFCVASNGGHAKIEHSLSVTGLIDFFPEHRFSAEDVETGKPAPDLFLYAAEAMGVPTEFARIVEDSKTGLMAARAANIKSFFFSADEGALGGECAELGATPFSKMAQLSKLLGVS